MEENELFGYKTQLINQLEYAKISCNNILINRPAQEIFFFIQSLLVALANIAKLFEGDSEISKKNQRAQELRIIFNFDFNSFPIIGDKALRNTNEHFDERIDNFIKISKEEGKAYGDCNVGTISIKGESGGFYCPNMIFMRHYDDKNRNILYVGRDLKSIHIMNLDKLNEELIRLEMQINNLRLY